MSQATYTQEGRNLHITIDGAFDRVITPANLQTGREIVTSLSLIAVGYAGDNFTAETFVKALGQGAWDAVQELRPEEFTEICNVAVFWQAYGGGWPVINTYLEEEHGDPKEAVELLFRRGGVNLTKVASQIYSNLESANQTETESTPATSSPQTSEPQSNEE